MTKVNKENWEYKKLGEICESIFSGGTPSRSIFSYWNGNIPWAKICDLRFMYLDKCEEFISKEGLANSSAKIFTKGTILYSIFATIGSSSIVNIDASCNLAIAGIKLKSGLNTQFYFYVLKHLKSHFESISKGVAQKNINLSILKNQVVPVPPIEEQNRISSQFEEIDNLITLKQEQLKEFDALEQSVFYKMFGDLVYNDKNWDISDIGSICLSIIRGPFGSALKKEFFVPKGEHTYKVYEQKNAIQCNELIGTYYIDQSRYKNLERFTVLPGDIIMSCAGTIGKLFLIPVLAERGIINQALIRFRLDHNRINEMFFLFLMGRVQNDFDVKGCGLKNLGSVKDLKKMTFGLPPLSLQQSFAQKIEVIEKQKEVVKNEIAQLQALLDSEMDKYFG